jgi:Asp-tRNA(Asn)/Glu-tRNA(Gln) amidotransferase A subunit family amidase
MRDKRADYNPETRRMLTLGAMIPAAAYANAHKARRLLSRAVREAFKANHLDALVGPAVPGVAHSLLGGIASRPSDHGKTARREADHADRTRVPAIDGLAHAPTRPPGEAERVK